MSCCEVVSQLFTPGGLEWYLGTHSKCFFGSKTTVCLCVWIDALVLVWFSFFVVGIFVLFWGEPFHFLVLDPPPPASPPSFLPLTSPEGEHIFLSVWHNQFQPSSRMSHFPSVSLPLSLLSSPFSLSVNIYKSIQLLPSFNQSHQIALNQISARRACVPHAPTDGNEEKETCAWGKLKWQDWSC